MSRMPRIEVKTIPGTVEEINRHLDTEQTEKKTAKPKKKKTVEKEE